MAIKAVLFDFDGTLIDSVPTILEAFRVSCGAMDLPYDEPVLKSWIGIPITAQAAMLAPGRERAFIDCYRDAYLQMQDTDIHLFHGSKDMLDELRLRGYKTGLVTSKNGNGTAKAIEFYDLSGRFDVVVSADDVENAKPHPEPILKAVEHLGIHPSEAIYVGDSYFDADCAIGAGAAMAGVPWGARTRDEMLPKCSAGVFDSWDEFIDWLAAESEMIAEML